MNYERLLVATFGAREGLADSLRFPVFLSSLSDDAVEALKETHKRLPKRFTRYVDEYDAMLADEVRGDYRYDFRVLLIPQAGPRTEADVAMRFVGLEDLPEDSEANWRKCERSFATGTCREQHRQAPAESGMREGQRNARCALHAQLRPCPRLEVLRRSPGERRRRPHAHRHPLPASGTRPHGDYVYTDAWIRKLATDLADGEKFWW